jgi:hypothetical protein
MIALTYKAKGNLKKAADTLLKATKLDLKNPSSEFLLGIHQMITLGKLLLEDNKTADSIDKLNSALTKLRACNDNEL